MLELGLKALLSYLLGSLLGALLIGKLKGGVDIRKVGSGNAGGTNALRTQGAMFAIGVMLVDIGKGVLAVAVIATASVTWLGAQNVLDWPHSSLWLQVISAVAVVAGHVYPLWYEFRGGKGAATLLGVLAALAPTALIPVMSAWLLVLFGTGFVGLATMMAAISFPVWLWIGVWDQPMSLDRLAMLAFGIFMTLFVCFTHRSNIVRMLKGTEPRSQRLWLLRSRG